MKCSVILVSLCFLAGLAMRFKPPTAAERIRAIGPTQGLPETLRKALDPGNDFGPIPTPGRHDWLANHPERGQTFDEFIGSKPNLPDKNRRKIYLLPLGEFPDDRSPPLGRLKEYAAAYFATEIEILPSAGLTDSNLTTRTHPTTRNRQILTGDVLRLLQKKLPPNAFCLLGITMEDLYPDPSWNFVFGQASLRDRVGVYSFARYDPGFYGNERGKDNREILLRRSAKVLVHETGHVFGLRHCVFFSCVMNGSNHLAESDARPMHLCPVCLRKLQHSIGFDVIKRYEKLFRFYKQAGWNKETSWVSDRLRWILGDQAFRSHRPPRSSVSSTTQQASGLDREGTSTRPR
jgi:archaemetzincin